MAVERMESSANVVALGRELGVPRTLLYKWRARQEELAEAGEPYPLTLEEENRQLKLLVAERELEVDFFRGALQKVEARRRPSNGAGGTASTIRCES